jgi:subtilisin family serine protease
MSSPHVAGVAALLLEEDPSLTPAELTDRMIADATPGVVDAPGDGSPNLMLYTGTITAPGASTPVPTPAPTPAPTSAPVPAPTPVPTPNCGAKFEPCNTDSDCCSGKCKGGKNNKSCK